MREKTDTKKIKKSGGKGEMLKKWMSAILALIFLFNSCIPPVWAREGNCGKTTPGEAFTGGALVGAVTSIACWIDPAAGAAGSIASDIAGLYMYYEYYDTYGETQWQFDLFGNEITVSKGQVWSMVAGMCAGMVAGYLSGALSGAGSGVASGMGQSFVQTAINIVVDCIKEIWKQIKEIFKESIKNILKRILTLITNLGKIAWNHIKDYFKSLWKSIMTKVEKVWKKIASGLKHIKDACMAIIDFIQQAGKDGIKETLRKIITNIKEGLKSLGKRLWTWLNSKPKAGYWSLPKGPAGPMSALGQALTKVDSWGALAQHLGDVSVQVFTNLLTGSTKLCAQSAGEQILVEKGWDEEIAKVAAGYIASQVEIAAEILVSNFMCSLISSFGRIGKSKSSEQLKFNLDDLKHEKTGGENPVFDGKLNLGDVANGKLKLKLPDYSGGDNLGLRLNMPSEPTTLSALILSPRVKDGGAYLTNTGLIVHGEAAQKLVLENEYGNLKKKMKTTNGLTIELTVKEVYNTSVEAFDGNKITTLTLNELLRVGIVGARKGNLIIDGETISGIELELGDGSKIMVVKVENNLSLESFVSKNGNNTEILAAVNNYIGILNSPAYRQYGPLMTDTKGNILIDPKGGVLNTAADLLLIGGLPEAFSAIRNQGLSPLVSAAAKIGILSALRYRTYYGRESGRTYENFWKMALADAGAGVAAGLMSNWDWANSWVAGTGAMKIITEDGKIKSIPNNPWRTRPYDMGFWSYAGVESLKQSGGALSQIVLGNYCRTHDIDEPYIAGLVHLAGSVVSSAVIDAFLRRDPGLAEQLEWKPVENSLASKKPLAFKPDVDMDDKESIPEPEKKWVKAYYARDPIRAGSLNWGTTYEANGHHWTEEEIRKQYPADAGYTISSDKEGIKVYRGDSFYDRLADGKYVSPTLQLITPYASYKRLDAIDKVFLNGERLVGRTIEDLNNQFVQSLSSAARFPDNFRSSGTGLNAIQRVWENQQKFINHVDAMMQGMNPIQATANQLGQVMINVAADNFGESFSYGIANHLWLPYDQRSFAAFIPTSEILANKAREARQEAERDKEKRKELIKQFKAAIIKMYGDKELDKGIAKIRAELDGTYIDPEGEYLRGLPYWVPEGISSPFIPIPKIKAGGDSKKLNQRKYMVREILRAIIETDSNSDEFQKALTETRTKLEQIAGGDSNKNIESIIARLVVYERGALDQVYDELKELNQIYVNKINDPSLQAREISSNTTVDLEEISNHLETQGYRQEFMSPEEAGALNLNQQYPYIKFTNSDGDMRIYKIGEGSELKGDGGLSQRLFNAAVNEFGLDDQSFYDRLASGQPPISSIEYSLTLDTKTAEPQSKPQVKDWDDFYADFIKNQKAAEQVNVNEIPLNANLPQGNESLTDVQNKIYEVIKPLGNLILPEIYKDQRTMESLSSKYPSEQYRILEGEVLPAIVHLSQRAKEKENLAKLIETTARTCAWTSWLPIFGALPQVGVLSSAAKAEKGYFDLPDIIQGGIIDYHVDSRVVNMGARLSKEEAEKKLAYEKGFLKELINEDLTMNDKQKEDNQKMVDEGIKQRVVRSYSSSVAGVPQPMVSYGNGLICELQLESLDKEIAKAGGASALIGRPKEEWRKQAPDEIEYLFGSVDRAKEIEKKPEDQRTVLDKEFLADFTEIKEYYASKGIDIEDYYTTANSVAEIASKLTGEEKRRTDFCSELEGKWVDLKWTEQTEKITALRDAKPSTKEITWLPLPGETEEKKNQVLQRLLDLERGQLLFSPQPVLTSRTTVDRFGRMLETSFYRTGYNDGVYEPVKLDITQQHYYGSFGYAGAVTTDWTQIQLPDQWSKEHNVEVTTPERMQKVKVQDEIGDVKVVERLKEAISDGIKTLEITWYSPEELKELLASPEKRKEVFLGSGLIAVPVEKVEEIYRGLPLKDKKLFDQILTKKWGKETNFNPHTAFAAQLLLRIDKNPDKWSQLSAKGKEDLVWYFVGLSSMYDWLNAVANNAKNNLRVPSKEYKVAAGALREIAQDIPRWNNMNEAARVAWFKEKGVGVSDLRAILDFKFPSDERHNINYSQLKKIYIPGKETIIPAGYDLTREDEFIVMPKEEYKTEIIPGSTEIKTTQVPRDISLGPNIDYKVNLYSTGKGASPYTGPSYAIGVNDIRSGIELYAAANYTARENLISECYETVYNASLEILEGMFTTGKASLSTPQYLRDMLEQRISQEPQLRNLSIAYSFFKLEQQAKGKGPVNIKSWMDHLDARINDSDTDSKLIQQAIETKQTIETICWSAGDAIIGLDKQGLTEYLGGELFRVLETRFSEYAPLDETGRVHSFPVSGVKQGYNFDGSQRFTKRYDYIYSQSGIREQIREQIDDAEKQGNWLDKEYYSGLSIIPAAPGRFSVLEKPDNELGTLPIPVYSYRLKMSYPQAYKTLEKWGDYYSGIGTNPSEEIPVEVK